jgi:phage terminase small subunit
MKQRGRKSAAAMSVALSVDGSPDRLQPPEHLSADERKRFVDIVTNCDARHFRPSDTTLLARFVEADALAEKAAAELRKHGAVSKDGKPNGWLVVQEKSVRALVSLSMRLRLSPQSRIDAKAIGRQEPRLKVNPWEWEPNDTQPKDTLE